MPPKYQPKRQAPKRFPWSDASQSDHTGPGMGNNQPELEKSSSRFDENGFLKRERSEPNSGLGSDFTPPLTSASNGSVDKVKPASRKPDLLQDPSERTSVYTETSFGPGRKLDSGTGENFWSDAPQPRRTSRGEPARSAIPQAPKRGQIPPAGRRAEPDFDHGRPAPRTTAPRTLAPKTRSAANDERPLLDPEPAGEAPHRPRKAGRPAPDPVPQATQVFEPEPEPGRKVARRERKKVEALKQQQQQTLFQWFKEVALLGVVAVGAAVLMTTYLVQAFFIPSISMENTLLVDDRVLVNKAVYRFSEPAYRDLVVFLSPDGTAAPPPADTPYARFIDRVAIGIGLKSSEQDLIKRVIATEGQTVEVRVGLVFVDGAQLNEPYRKDDIPMRDFPATVVPDNHVFVLGDNRSNSADSRSFGPVDESTIIGKAFARIWPLDRIEMLK